jgi:hypothetical protein
MSDERAMFDYERPAGPPPRWWHVVVIVMGAVMLWQNVRLAVSRQQIVERVGYGYEEAALMRVAGVLLPLSVIALGASGLLKRPIIRKIVGAVSLAVWVVAVVTFVASFFTE